VSRLPSSDFERPTSAHANAPLSVEGRRRLVKPCQTRPNAHVAAEMGISFCEVEDGPRVGPRCVGGREARQVLQEMEAVKDGGGVGTSDP